MGSFDKNHQKQSFLFSLYQLLLQLMGKKRFYAEIQIIDKKLNCDASGFYNNPPNGLVLKALVELLGTIIKRIYQKIFWIEQWYLLLNIEENFSRSFSQYKRIIPPLDRYWADPHIVQKNNRYYVFVEEFLYSWRKGRISVIEVDELGNHKDSVPVLEKDYHLSYPFIFKHEDKYYMVPESSENKTIDLYESVEFPYSWRFVMHLMENVVAVDTTLLYHANKWWLFTAMPENPESLPMVKLFLFFSEMLTTDNWRPHPQNPIVSDMVSARPAGKIFAQNGNMYRPSQDGSISYGNGFDINEINLLSETEYVEKRTISVRPNWDKKVKGTHTFSREGQLTVIDVFRWQPRIFT
jgi:hypothetical protein